MNTGTWSLTSTGGSGALLILYEILELYLLPAGAILAGILLMRKKEEADKRVGKAFLTLGILLAVIVLVYKFIIMQRA